MAEKRFAGIDGSVDAPEVTADFDSAQVFERLRVGELGVYFRDGLKTRFIPYAYIDRAFIRVQETRSRMCCGQKEFADHISEKEALMDDALAAIGAHGVATGFVKSEAST